MNTEALFLFLILLLGLVLCSFLGGNCGKEGMTGNFSGTINVSGNSSGYSGSSTGSGSQYDNYNHYTGSSTQLSNGSTFYGQNGTTAVVVANSDGTQSLQITLPGSSTPVTFTPQQSSTDASSSSVESYINYYGYNGTATTYYGPNGDTATVVNADNGQQAIRVTTSSGTYYYNVSGSQNATNTSTQYYGSTGSQIQQAPYAMSYQGPYGGSAGAVTGPYGNTAYYAQGPAGNTVAGTTSTSSNQYYGPYGGSAGAVTGPYGNTAYYAQGPAGNTVAGTTSTSSNQYYGPYGGSAGAVTGPYGNTAYYAQGPAGNTVAGTTADTDYSSTLPPGIPRSQIPPGQEDLYILKSEIVPPVCPACPTSAACPREEKCPPCPACARCPEPAFECKKVPNYSAINNEYLPAPVLNDFSTFGT